MQQPAPEQRNMAMLGEAQKIEDVPMELVSRCRSARDALRLCVQWSGLKHSYIAESLNLQPAQFSRILSGQAHLSEDLRIPLMEICHNRAPLQWQAWQMGRKLVVDDTEEEYLRLQERLRQIESQRRVA